MNVKLNFTRFLLLLTTVCFVCVTLSFSYFFPATPLYANEGNKTMIEKMPLCLQKLFRATSFDDSHKGETAEASENYKAYAEAASMISGLESTDLEYLRDHASPAGRVYAAVLLKSSGRVGDNLSFEKLLKDNSELTYRSGCKGIKTTVGEVASGFMKNGRYYNFSYSIFCKLKAPNPNAAPPEKNRE